MRAIDLFHIGPQKSGTTWIYSCLKEHPEVVCALKDSVHYYDMFYHLGLEWYAQKFPKAEDHQLIIDHTPSYIRSPWVAKRIFADNPGAKIIVCLRNPIDRAFSHYWHEKKKKKINFEFSEILTNYDLFSSWFETGFYAEHIERYLEYFPREQVFLQRFEHLEEDPVGFLKEFLGFINVSTDFQPSILHEKINVAGAKQDLFNRSKNYLNHVGSKLFKERWHSGLYSKWLSGKDEYIRGIPEDLRAELLKVATPEIERLETLLGADLSKWKMGKSGEDALAGR